MLSYVCIYSYIVIINDPQKGGQILNCVGILRAILPAKLANTERTCLLLSPVKREVKATIVKLYTLLHKSKPLLVVFIGGDVISVIVIAVTSVLPLVGTIVYLRTHLEATIGGVMVKVSVLVSTATAVSPGAEGVPEW